MIWSHLRTRMPVVSYSVSLAGLWTPYSWLFSYPARFVYGLVMLFTLVRVLIYLAPSRIKWGCE